jgi:uncharacterized membrane protein
LQKKTSLRYDPAIAPTLDKIRSTGMDVEAAERIRLVPNCSLSVRAATLFFASLCLTSFGIAALCAARGFWPVLPFAGGEMLLLGWALWDSLRRRHCAELITVTEDQVQIDAFTRQGHDQVVFPRHWAQVKLRRAGSPLHPSRLLIESHGRSYELGKFLTEEERSGLAGRLRRSIGRINETPRLAGRN